MSGGQPSHMEQRRANSAEEVPNNSRSKECRDKFTASGTDPAALNSSINLVRPDSLIAPSSSAG